MPRGGKRSGAGRPKGSREHTLRDKVEENRACLPVVVQPKRLVDVDDKDAAAQADEIMQFAGRMMRKAKALLEDTPENLSPAAVRDEFMQWMNVVMRAASMLLPYQRPTYRSIEVRTDKGLEERASRYIGDPAERLAQIITSAIISQPDIPMPTHRPQPDGAPEPVDNGDGVIS